MINKRIFASLGESLDLRYAHFKQDTSPYSKIARSLGTIDSKYSVVCADDDFLVPRSLDQCVQFLESNPDYAVAHGRIVSLPTCGRWTYCRSQQTIDSADPRLRLCRHLANYEGTFYSVHRRSDLKRIMQLTAKTTRDYRFGELLPSCLSVIKGKVMRLNILHGVRPENPDAISSRMVGWPALITSDDFSQRYMQFRNCLARELVSIADMPIAESRNAVNQAFLLYLTQVLEGAYRGEMTRRGLTRLQRAWQTGRLLHRAARSAFFDQRLAAMIRSPREFIRTASVGEEFSTKNGYMSVDSLLDHRSPFHDDFLPIYKCVKNPGAKRLLGTAV
jgi:glycosyltransferase domain-containing protein